MHPTVKKVLQILAIVIIGMIALNLVTGLVLGAVRLLLQIGLLFGLCLLVYGVATRVRT